MKYRIHNTSPAQPKYIPSFGDYFRYVHKLSEISETDRVFLRLNNATTILSKEFTHQNRIVCVDLTISCITWFDIDASSVTFIKLCPISLATDGTEGHLIFEDAK